MKAYWYNLNEREKWMVAIAAICVFFYVYYLLLYAPLSTRVATKNKQLYEKTSTLKWMEQATKIPKLKTKKL